MTLPLLVIGVIAAVEMGLWMSGRERLEMATKVGVEEAALSLKFDEVQRRVQSYLQNANVPINNIEILLIHNVNGGARLSSSKDTDWSGLQLPPPPESQSPYVRLVVRVPSSNLAPNMLRTFGFDLEQHHSVHVKTMRYEGN